MCGKSVILCQTSKTGHTTKYILSYKTSEETLQRQLGKTCSHDQVLKLTEKLPLILSADNSDNLYWYADSVFGAHADMKSHNGAGLTLGRGSAISISSGQKLNVSSSTDT